MKNAQDVNANDASGQLSMIAKMLTSASADSYMASLQSLRRCVDECDMSAFELMHSGLIAALHAYLTPTVVGMSQTLRLRLFLQVMAGVTMKTSASGFTTVVVDPAKSTPTLTMLVGRLLDAVAHAEQFNVHTNDIQTPSGQALRGVAALRFFQTHQIKVDPAIYQRIANCLQCTLRRHATACSRVRDWRPSSHSSSLMPQFATVASIRVDPLTPIHAIERYVRERGVIRKNAAPSDVSAART